MFCGVFSLNETFFAAPMTITLQLLSLSSHVMTKNTSIRSGTRFSMTITLRNFLQSLHDNNVAKLVAISSSAHAHHGPEGLVSGPDMLSVSKCRTHWLATRPRQALCLLSQDSGQKVSFSACDSCFSLSMPGVIVLHLADAEKSRWHPYVHRPLGPQ